MTSNEVLSRVVPQFFPKHWLDTAEIVFSDFPSRIRIGYVLRAEGSYSYMMQDEFSRLGLSVPELHAAAVENLAALPSASISIGKLPGGAEGWLTAKEDNFAAARILLPTVQQEFSDVLGESFLIALSHRDDCFCWSITQAAERQKKHAQEARERFLHEEYNLTPDILKFSDGEFALHLEQPVG